MNDANQTRLRIDLALGLKAWGQAIADRYEKVRCIGCGKPVTGYNAGAGTPCCSYQCACKPLPSLATFSQEMGDCLLGKG